MRLSDHEFNRIRVLKALRRHAPIARIDLAQAVGLNAATITEIVGDLVSRGLVMEEKSKPQGRGRPKTNLRINKSGGLVATALLTWDGELHTAILDLDGATVYRRRQTVEQTKSLEAVAIQIAGALERTMAASFPLANEIIQVGIGLPAVVNFRTGVVEYMETFEPGPCPFARIVEERLGIPTIVDRDVALLARAVHWHGHVDELEDLTVIVVGLGLGSANYFGGQLSIGAHGISPEFGHMKAVPYGGRSCHCGGFGCLQTYSSISGIVAQVCEQRGEQVPHFIEWPGYIRRLMSSTDCMDAVADVVERACWLFGMAIANHIMTFDPSRIVILFYEEVMNEAMREGILRAVNENVAGYLAFKTVIEFENVSKDLFTLGAASMALECIYANSK